MTTKLYAVAGSPFSWRVQLALLFKGARFEIVPVRVSEGGLRSAEFLAMNPRGKVPVLQDDDFVLYESSVMLEYIDERFPDGPRLFPKDIAARARVRRLINEMDLYYDVGADKLANNLYFKKPEAWNLEEIEEGRQIVAKELEFFENEVRGEFLAGDLSAADFALYPGLAHLARYELRRPELGLTAKLGPKLQGLMRGIEALPYYADTYPPHWK